MTDSPELLLNSNVKLSKVWQNKNEIEYGAVVLYRVVTHVRSA